MSNYLDPIRFTHALTQFFHFQDFTLPKEIITLVLTDPLTQRENYKPQRSISSVLVK